MKSPKFERKTKKKIVSFRNILTIQDWSQAFWAMNLQNVIGAFVLLKNEREGITQIQQRQTYIVLHTRMGHF